MLSPDVLEKRRPSLLSLALAPLLALCACSATEDDAATQSAPAPAGVVWITVGNLGVNSVESPEDLLPQAVYSDRIVAPSPVEVQSLAALQVGRLPTRAGTIGVTEAQPPEAAPTLATRLRRQGWGTAWVGQRSWGGRAGFTRGFDIVDVPSEKDRSAQETADAGLEALEALSGQTPFYLAAHLAVPFEEMESDGAVVEATLDAVRQLASAAAALDDVAVVVTGSNGFERGEHGGRGVGFTVFEEAIRTPLWVHWPQADLAMPASQRSLLDVTATVLAWAGLIVEDGELDGQPLFDAAAPRILLSEVVVREWAIARAVVGPRYKYVHAVRQVPLEDRAVVASGLAEIQAAMQAGTVETPELFGRAVAEALYDLQGDAQEASSLLDDPAAADALTALRSALRDYRRACDATAYPPGEVAERLTIDPSKMRDLESLGYL